MDDIDIRDSVKMAVKNVLLTAFMRARSVLQVAKVRSSSPRMGCAAPFSPGDTRHAAFGVHSIECQPAAFRKIRSPCRKIRSSGNGRTPERLKALVPLVMPVGSGPQE